MSARSLSQAPWPRRVEFLVKVAECLHIHGTTAQRLEGALLGMASRLGMKCEPWVNPTGMILTLRDLNCPESSDVTRVIRLPLGDVDLSRLAMADQIAEDVLAGRMGLAEGQRALETLDRVPTWRWNLLQILAFAMVAFGVGCLLRLPWLDIFTASCGGLGVGLLVYAVGRHPSLREPMEVLAAMLAAMLAVGVASFVGPLNLNTVIIAAVIVLLPGMELTNAVSELTSQHLVSGTARLAGALSIILKLTIGTMLVLHVAELAGIQPRVAASRPQPDWVEWTGLAVACLSFAVVFRAARRDYLIVMLAAASGFLISRHVGDAFGNVAGVFVSALVITMAGNLYARWRNRPGALIRLPGIILLVPGSVSFRGLMTLMQEQSLAQGQSAFVSVLNILLALLAGLMLGNLLAPPRRNI